MLDVVVDRSKWCRGGRGGKSRLLNSEGNMCCLGFATLADGAYYDEIKNIAKPSEVPTQPTILCRLLKQDLKLEDDLVCTNDTSQLSDDKRENLLKQIGNKAGINFVFTN